VISKLCALSILNC